MLDINLVRDHTDSVRTACIHKNIDPSVVDSLLLLDEKRRDLITQSQEFRKQRNDLNNQLKQNRDSKLIAESVSLKSQLEKLETSLADIEVDYLHHLYQLPNIPFDDVPVGKDESENVVIKKVGEPPHFSFLPKDHMELGTSLDIIDTETAAKVTGARFGYLKGGAAMLEFALIQFTMQTLTNPDLVRDIANSVKSGYNPQPFIPVVPPVIIKPEVFRRMARLSDADKDERYHLDQDNLYLVGSAEHTLGSMFIDQTIPESRLPIRYIGFSTAFRREAGSYGKDTKGILRVHQFDKLEMESFCLPEDSRTEQDFFVAVQEYLVSQLQIPYQLVAICTGDMGKPDARQIDVECWLPGQNKYRETHTSDLMTDYQSRRLNTRVSRKSGENQYIHMNDATAIAIGRMIIAIIENYQQADGSVKIPEALVPYVGFDTIRAQ